MKEIDAINNLDTAMRNSYDLILGYTKIEDLLMAETVLFIHDIDEPITLGVINILIEYFKDTEEYEKCMELKKVKCSLETTK